MKTPKTPSRNLLTSGMLNNGEARHCSVWNFPGVPRIDHPYSQEGQAVYRRQKAFAPQTRSSRGLLSLIYALRRSR